MPTAAVAISMRPDDPLITRLSEMLQPTSVDASSDAKESMGISNLRINEALQFVSELQLATNRCTAAIQASYTKYRTKPDMEQLLNDIASAKVYSNQREAVEAAFVARAPDLPEDASLFMRMDG